MGESSTHRRSQREVRVVGEMPPPAERQGTERCTAGSEETPRGERLCFALPENEDERGRGRVSRERERGPPYL